MSRSSATPKIVRSLSGLPGGSLLIILIEFWERFSFYGMLAILVLFLTAAPEEGGFGWERADALALLGVYSALMYSLPWLGGLVADRFLGNRRAIIFGLIIMTIGHFLMAGPWLLLEFAAHDQAAAIKAVAPLGQLFPSHELSSLNAGERALYGNVAWAFYAALSCLVIGNALMKSTLAVTIGDLFDQDDHRRDTAFSYFYVSISVGALLSGFSVGILSSWLGWHAGFTLAGVGMAVALVLYLVFAERLLGNIGKTRKSDKANGTNPANASALQGEAARTPGQFRAVAVIFCLGLFLSLFMAGWFQLYGSWTLVIEDEINRSFGGFEAPTPWFTALNSAVVIIVTPIASAWLVRVAQRGGRFDIVNKYASALLLCAAGQAVMAVTAGGALFSIGWILAILAIVLLSLGELIAWPSTYGMVYSVAPKRWVASIMGAWYLLALGLSGYMSGWIGGAIAEIGPRTGFLLLAAALGAAGLLCLALGPVLRAQAKAVGAKL